MRRASPGRGFWISFLINLAFRYQWLILAAAVVLLHFIFKSVPLWLALVPLALWLIHALVITIVLRLISRVPTDVFTPRPNKNPYSKKTENYLPGRDQKDEVTDDQSDFLT